MSLLGTRGVDAVVIGASAGGVEALTVLLPALPAGLDVVVLVVLHQLRDRPSRLVEIFAPRCALAVREAEDKDELVDGTVYFAPPDYHLLVEHGPRLALSVDAPLHFSRPAIDVLFESAADVYGNRLLSLLLTGANEDGADGTAAVARGGGITVVQDPDDAKVPYMPAAALSRGPVDQVLPLAAIAALLGSLKSGSLR